MSPQPWPESQDLLMVANWHFIWGCISMRPAGIYKSHDLLAYISWSTDIGLWTDYQVKDCCPKWLSYIYKSWPPDLYFMVHWLRTLARLSRLRFLSTVESQHLLKLFYNEWEHYQFSPLYSDIPVLCKHNNTVVTIWWVPNIKYICTGSLKPFIGHR